MTKSFEVLIVHCSAKVMFVVVITPLSFSNISAIHFSVRDTCNKQNNQNLFVILKMGSFDKY
jgi:hypothetical protein